MAQMLVAKRANLNATNNVGVSALMAAAAAGHPQIVEHLLANGANVNLKTIEGRTALMLAVRSGMADISSLLLAGKAEVDAKDEQGSTALMLASRICEPGESTALSPNELNEVLLKTISMPKGGVQHSRAAIVKVLLSNQADVNAKDKNDTTALMLAAGRGQVEMVKLLLEAKADVNAKDGKGWTAMKWASCRGTADRTQGFTPMLTFQGDAGASDIDYSKVEQYLKAAGGK